MTNFVIFVTILFGYMETKTKKQLKEDYKLMKFKAGVFGIRNTVNNKLYLGSSVNMDAMWNRSRVQLDFGSHPNAELQDDWKSIGKDKFAFEIISEIKQKDDGIQDVAKEVKDLELLYLDELKPFGERGYNKHS
jgi:hypothetical protein